VIFDTIPPKLGLSAWGDFPIVGHGGGAKGPQDNSRACPSI
jgi:hypothetical protein